MIIVRAQNTRMLIEIQLVEAVLMRLPIQMRSLLEIRITFWQGTCTHVAHAEGCARLTWVPNWLTWWRKPQATPPSQPQAWVLLASLDRSILKTMRESRAEGFEKLPFGLEKEHVWSWCQKKVWLLKKISVSEKMPRMLHLTIAKMPWRHLRHWP